MAAPLDHTPSPPPPTRPRPPAPPPRPRPLRRPPIRQSTTVRSDVQHTFTVFVREIGAWWPTAAISAGRERVRSVTVEPHEGGRVYETWDDDTTVDWGELLV